jgi:hypothetical protein
MTGNPTKIAKLELLAKARSEARWGPDYNQVADFHGGIYESRHITPYTRGACNCDAEFMILLQDWCSAEFLSGPVDQNLIRLGRDPTLPTNINLVKLLRTLNVDLHDTYGANLFPFIKVGGMSAHIKRSDLQRAAIDYAVPQVSIVQPRVLICLGLSVFQAMQFATGNTVSRSVAKGIDSPFKFEKSWVWLQAHTGRLGRINRNRGGIDRVSSDWERMAAAIALKRRNEEV